MAVGDLHTITNRVGDVEWEIVVEELPGHDPDTDNGRFQVTSPIRATGVGIVTVEMVNRMTGVPLWHARFDVCTQDDEWDQFTLTRAQSATIDWHGLRVDAAPGSKANPHRTRQPGQSIAAPIKAGGRQ